MKKKGLKQIIPNLMILIKKPKILMRKPP